MKFHTLLLRLMGYTWVPPKHKPHVVLRAAPIQQPREPLGERLMQREPQEIHVRRLGFCAWVISIPAVAPIKVSGDVRDNSVGIPHPYDGDSMDLHLSAKIEVDGRELELGGWLHENRWAIERVTGKSVTIGEKP